jgi:hypothetical protein
VTQANAGVPSSRCATGDNAVAADEAAPGSPSRMVMVQTGVRPGEARRVAAGFDPRTAPMATRMKERRITSARRQDRDQCT